MPPTSAASSKAFFTAAIYSTNEANKAGSKCHKAVYFLRCLILPALFVSLVLLVAAAKKCLGRCDASSGHITKLKQSILFRYL